MCVLLARGRSEIPARAGPAHLLWQAVEESIDFAQHIRRIGFKNEMARMRQTHYARGGFACLERPGLSSCCLQVSGIFRCARGGIITKAGLSVRNGVNGKDGNPNIRVLLLTGNNS